MTSEQIEELVDSIPEHWYEMATRTVEVGIATRYHTYSCGFYQHTHTGGITALSFLIEINNVKHMPDVFFEEDGILQRVDVLLRGVTKDMAIVFAQRLANTNGYEFSLLTNLAREAIVSRIIKKISKLSDSLRNKNINHIVIRNQKDVADIIGVNGKMGECGNQYQQIVYANMLNGIIPNDDLSVSLNNLHSSGGYL